jgi:hypothetical protein
MQKANVGEVVFDNQNGVLSTNRHRPGFAVFRGHLVRARGVIPGQHDDFAPVGDRPGSVG